MPVKFVSFSSMLQAGMAEVRFLRGHVTTGQDSQLSSLSRSNPNGINSPQPHRHPSSCCVVRTPSQKGHLSMLQHTLNSSQASMICIRKAEDRIRDLKVPGANPAICP